MSRSDTQEGTPYRPEHPILPYGRLVGREGRGYFPDEALIVAANVALACRRPLLLTGDAGCGKTDFAYAAAHALDARPGTLLECTVRSDTRARDLLYHYDAVRRFSDAQLRAAAGTSQIEVPADEAGRYIRLQPLGRALVSAARRVVLLDEIDKAPRDLPNDLLVPLEQRAFDILEIAPTAKPFTATGEPALAAKMAAPAGAEALLVIITSNVERQLPEPFLRRCVFYHIPFPSKARLREILEDRFALARAEPLWRDGVLEIFGALHHSRAGLTKRPGTAELIDWATALSTVFELRWMHARLGELGAALKQADGGSLRKLPWRRLPGLSCLIKLREDLEHLAALEPDGAW